MHNGITLYSQIKRQAAIGNRLEGKTKFAHAGTALEGGCVNAIAVDRAFGLAVKLMFPLCAKVRGEMFVHGVGEAPARRIRRESLSLKRALSPCTVTESPSYRVQRSFTERSRLADR